MDERTKEIRRVLRGLITYENGGAVIVSTPSLLQLQTDGVFRGADSAGVLGVGVTARQYAIKGRIQDTQMECVKAMLRLGRQVLLASSPDTMAVLHRPVLFNPAVLTLDAQDDQLLFCVYTARTPLAALHVKRIVRAWEQEVPGRLRETPVTVSPPGTQTKKKKERPEKGKKERKGGKKSGNGGKE